MKLRSILSFLILSMAVSVHAQSVPSRLKMSTPESPRVDLKPRGAQELLFSLSHIHADTMSVPLTSMPLILREIAPISKVHFAPKSYSFKDYIQNSTGVNEDNRLCFEPSRADALNREILNAYMMSHPDNITYLSWTLPDPPRLLPTENHTDEYLIADIPIEEVDMAPLPGMLEDVKRTNWLHKTNASLQFSQAYLSPNWYQGGNNSLSLLVNLLWDVRLNEVYHPSLLFESTLSYKLGLNSTPQDSIHKYSVSEDLLQYNLKFGVRARHKWFYSFTTQFKTQFLNVYGENSRIRKAAFMSPGELNLGLGMTYATTANKGRLKLNVSLAPASYNIKTCIDPHVDPTQFSIEAGRKTYSQVGSSAEATLDWKIVSNINLRSRLFLFTNYNDFQGDLENTINFSVNKFLSTQIYVHLRYDTTSEQVANKWRHWMLKEILSFGFNYTFSTK